MKRESLVSITDFSKEEILDLLEKARRFEENPNRKILEGKVVATLFFEPSTRTRLSFETAVNRLGGKVIGFSDASTTSSSEGETLKDTIMMVSNYVDLIIMRHHLEGAARYASEISSVPVINAGDGAKSAPLANHARFIFHLQDTRLPIEPEHHYGGRLKIRTHRTLPADGYVSFQSHIPFRRTR